MRRKTRTKVKKSLGILGIVIGIFIIISLIVIIIKTNKKEEITYEDGVVCKNYFKEIKIDLNKKEITRDKKVTTLMEEFNISEEEQNLIGSSVEEMKTFLSNSAFEISENEGIFTITNKFQTKSIIVKAEEIKEKVEGEEIIKILDNLYVLKFDTEKLAKAMYTYYSTQNYIEKIFYDDVFIDEPTQDISQTMYGQTEIDLNNYHCLGVTSMGLDNYQKIINENGNPQNITIATIGYGANIQNEIFNDRIHGEFYDFILNKQETKESIPQGSRILEVLADSTTSNIKIMPLITVNDEGYITLSSIVKALSYAISKTDVICYELINTQNEPIDLLLEEAFKQNIPVVCTTTSENKNYPAEHGMTIAVSSVDRNESFADYSGKGEYIDFTASSTDIAEIFKNNSTVSRWSGPSYSNAQITSAIAMIKTYNKNATILDIYNFLRNFCVDIGNQGKDEQYGYGYPKFQNLTISDIDKEKPEFKEVICENETWQIKKDLKIVANDNIRISSWTVSNNEEVPEDATWNVLENITPTLDVTTEITENGTYYIWLKDSAGNINNAKLQVDKIDNLPPQITYAINKDTLQLGYVTVTVTAQDTQSGLYDSPYSWDKVTWSQENGTRNITKNGRYKVYAEDNLGNIGELEFVVDCFQEEGTYELGEGDIIESIKVPADWTGNINNSVRIELNSDLDISAYQITSNPYSPQDYIVVRTLPQQNTETQENTELQNNSTTNNSVTNENVTNNTILENNTSVNNINSNVVDNTISNNVPNQVAQLDEPIVITKPIEINTIYYIWIKDLEGNVQYQTFSIAKPVY